MLRSKASSGWVCAVAIAVTLSFAVHCSKKREDTARTGKPPKASQTELVRKIQEADCLQSALPPDTVVLRPQGAGPIGQVSSIHEYRLGAYLVACRRGTPGVYLFSPTGELVAAIGRKGEGPGEFMEPVKAVLSPDGKVVVYDGTLRRVTVFDARGRFLSSFEVSIPAGGDHVGLIVDGEGRVVLHDPFDYLNTHCTVWVYTPEGKLVRTFGRVSTEFRTILDHVPLTRSEPFLVWANGYYFETDPGSYEIRVYDSSGQLVRHFGTRPARWRSLAEADFSMLPPHGMAFGPSMKEAFDRFNAEMNASSFVCMLGRAPGGLLFQCVEYGSRFGIPPVLMVYDLNGRSVRLNLPLCRESAAESQGYVVPGLGGGMYRVEYPEELGPNVRVVCFLHADVD